MPYDRDSIASLSHQNEWQADHTTILDRQWANITDQGSNYSAGGYVQFNPSANGLSDLWIDYDTSEFLVPAAVTFPGLPAGATPPQIGNKAGFDGWLSQTQMDSGGSSIVSEGTSTSYWTAPIRPCLEKSVAWLQSQAATTTWTLPDSTHLSSAYPASGTNNTALAYTNLAGGAPVSTAVAQAIQYWNQNATWNPTTNTSTIMLRFRFPNVHPIFRTFGGCRKVSIDNIKLFLQLNAQNQSPIFVVPSSLPANYTTLPTLSILGTNACQFRFQVLTLSPAQHRKAMEQYNSDEPLWYTGTMMGIQSTNNTSVSSVQVLVQPSVVRAERVFLHLLPSTVAVTFPNGAGAGTASTGAFMPTSAYDLYPFAQDSTYAPSEVNIILGSQQLFQQNLARRNQVGYNYQDLFYQFADCCSGTLIPGEIGGLVDIMRYQNACRYFVLNISRAGPNTSTDSDSPQQLQAMFTLNGGQPVAPYNLTPVIESLEYAVIKKGIITKPPPPKR